MNYRARMICKVGLMLPQRGHPLAVGVTCRTQHMRRPADQDGVRGYQGARRDQRPLAEDAAVAQQRPRHQDRAVTDLAQITDSRADDYSPVAEDGALSMRTGHSARPDNDAVFQYRRKVADRHVRVAVGSNHQPLGQHGSGPDMCRPEHHRAAGHHRGRLIRARTVQTHRTPRSRADSH